MKTTTDYKTLLAHHGAHLMSLGVRRLFIDGAHPGDDGFAPVMYITVEADSHLDDHAAYQALSDELVQLVGMSVDLTLLPPDISDYAALNKATTRIF